MANVIQKSLAATKVDYRRLGSSGLKVSVPVLGGMSFGDKRWAPWVIEEEQALPLLKYAYDKGLNTWDTANIYSHGRSEEIIGTALKKYNIPREKVVILTKCWAYVGEDQDAETLKELESTPKTKDYVNQGGLSRGAILRAVDKSLKRLGTDYIDLLQIHRFDYDTPIEETMSALNDLVRSGKVHYIGASSMFAYQFVMMQNVAEKNGWTKFVSQQFQHSLLYREEEREMMRYCKETGVGTIPWGPLSSGSLARPAESHGSTTRSEGTKERFSTGTGEADKKIVDRVQELAEKKGWKMSQVAMAWSIAKVTSPIVGFSSEQRIEESLDVRGKELTADEIKYLEELYVTRKPLDQLMFIPKDRA